LLGTFCHGQNLSFLRLKQLNYKGLKGFCPPFSCNIGVRLILQNLFRQLLDYQDFLGFYISFSFEDIDIPLEEVGVDKSSIHEMELLTKKAKLAIAKYEKCLEKCRKRGKKAALGKGGGRGGAMPGGAAHPAKPKAAGKPGAGGKPAGYLVGLPALVNEKIITCVDAEKAVEKARKALEDFEKHNNRRMKKCREKVRKAALKVEAQKASIHGLEKDLKELYETRRHPGGVSSDRIQAAFDQNRRDLYGARKKLIEYKKALKRAQAHCQEGTAMRDHYKIKLDLAMEVLKNCRDRAERQRQRILNDMFGSGPEAAHPGKPAAKGKGGSLLRPLQPEVVRIIRLALKPSDCPLCESLRLSLYKVVGKLVRLRFGVGMKTAAMGARERALRERALRTKVKNALLKYKKCLEKCHKRGKKTALGKGAGRGGTAPGAGKGGLLLRPEGFKGKKTTKKPGAGGKPAAYLIRPEEFKGKKPAKKVKVESGGGALTGPAGTSGGGGKHKGAATGRGKMDCDALFRAINRKQKRQIEIDKEIRTLERSRDNCALIHNCDTTSYDNDIAQKWKEHKKLEDELRGLRKQWEKCKKKKETVIGGGRGGAPPGAAAHPGKLARKAKPKAAGKPGAGGKPAGYLIRPEFGGAGHKKPSKEKPKKPVGGTPGGESGKELRPATSMGMVRAAGEGMSHMLAAIGKCKECAGLFNRYMKISMKMEDLDKSIKSLMAAKRVAAASMKEDERERLEEQRKRLKKKLESCLKKCEKKHKAARLAAGKKVEVPPLPGEKPALPGGAAHPAKPKGKPKLKAAGKPGAGGKPAGYLVRPEFAGAGGKNALPEGKVSGAGKGKAAKLGKKVEKSSSEIMRLAGIPAGCAACKSLARRVTEIRSELAKLRLEIKLGIKPAASARIRERNLKEKEKNALSRFKKCLDKCRKTGKKTALALPGGKESKPAAHALGSGEFKPGGAAKPKVAIPGAGGARIGRVPPRGETALSLGGACIPGAGDITKPIIRDMPASESAGNKAKSAIGGLAKGALGGMLGGGGGMFGGGPFGGGGGGARLVRKPKGPWDAVKSGKTALKLGGWAYKPHSRKVQPQIRIAQRITDAPDNGGPDSMWLQDGNGNILSPTGYMVFELWRHWRLTITITRESYVNGELVSRSVSRESMQWKELVDRYKVLMEAPSIWERLGGRPFDKLKGVIVEFPLPQNFDPSKWSLVTHVTSKAKVNGKEVIRTVPFVMDIVPGKGKRLRLRQAADGKTQYQRSHPDCPGGENRVTGR